jgi:hypothetical protein
LPLELLLEELPEVPAAELLEPSPTPSALSVWLSSLPVALMPCDCWNCFTAACVFGPHWPSGFTLMPLSFRASCACRTVAALVEPLEADIERPCVSWEAAVESFDAPWERCEWVCELFAYTLALVSTRAATAIILGIMVCLLTSWSCHEDGLDGGTLLSCGPRDAPMGTACGGATTTLRARSLGRGLG